MESAGGMRWSELYDESVGGTRWRVPQHARLSEVYDGIAGGMQ